MRLSFLTALFPSLLVPVGIFTLGYITSLSDKFGRKTLIFLTLIPVALTQALIVFMAHPSTNVGLAPLYADALFMGILGAGMLLEPCIMAYVGKVLEVLLTVSMPEKKCHNL